jgi:hypothetical protein
MGTLAETAIVDYRLSFADQEKQTFRFSFPYISMYSTYIRIRI